MRVHFIGVSGTGMGALAMLFREAGHEVSGSDAAFDPPIGPALEAVGIRCLRGYDAAHLDDRPDLVVVGNAIRRDNPEATRVRESGMRARSMSEALRETFLAGRRPLVVCGTHGKTTTSAMCAWLLQGAGLEPGYFIGGLPKNLPAGAAIGSTKRRLGVPEHERGKPAPFVVEGDEYDAVYWHKEPKFLDYVGVGDDDVVIVTSVEHDHVDIYPDPSSYERSFARLAERVPSGEGGGLLVVDAAQKDAVRVVRGAARARIAYYAIDGDDTGDVTPTWLAAMAPPEESGAQAFDLFAGGVYAGRYVLPVPGRHNVRNALAALAACAEGFGVPLTGARSTLARFEGVRRRQDLLGEPAGVRVYDDFAHHPTAVAETLAALRARHPQGALWVAFEPRSATACRSLHQEAYARAFDRADRVLLAPLGRSNVPEGERLDVAKLATDLGDKAEATSSVDALLARIVEGARAGDTVALLSNGAFAGVHARLLAALGARS